MNNVYVTKILIEDVEHSEIDFDLHKEFDFDYEKSDDLVEIQMGQGDADGYPISIDKMLKTLKAMKKKGATHVEMNYHCDHIGYEISGYQMRLSTPEEIGIRIDTEMKSKEKADKIAALYNEIKNLQS